VHFLAHTAGSAPPQEDARPSQAEGAEDSEYPEGSRNNEDSILENLSPLSVDASSINSEEYDALMKEMKDREKADAESAPPKHVFATVVGLDEDGELEKTPPHAAIPGPSESDAPLRVRAQQREQPPGRALNFQEGITDEVLIAIAGKRGEHVKKKEILTKPITAE
jgi:hypothetical protein